MVSGSIISSLVIPAINYYRKLGIGVEDYCNQGKWGRYIVRLIKNLDLIVAITINTFIIIVCRRQPFVGTELCTAENRRILVTD